ncbi:hypothetical protein AgCh_017594 [Apium graveolens]
MDSSDFERWLEAMKFEMESIYQNKVLTLVDPLKGVKTIGCNWVFKKKTDKDGKVQSYKTRLVAKSFKQIHGIDFSPVTMVKFIRILLAIVAYFDYDIWQMDVKTAFLYGSLEQDAYMIQPEGFVDPKFANTVFQAVAPFVLQQYTSDAIHTMLSDISSAISNVDSDHPVLKEEQDAQIGQGTRGDVIILPTLVVNNRKYQEETTEPAVCLSGDVETNEYLSNNGGCWQDKAPNISACKDTFRARVCECPFTDGVLYKGDGYRSCIASGPGRCKVNNGGCSHETHDGHTFSACPDNADIICVCPPGFKGDGVESGEDFQSLVIYGLRDQSYHGTIYASRQPRLSPEFKTFPVRIVTRAVKAGYGSESK